MTQIPFPPYERTAGNYQDPVTLCVSVQLWSEKKKKNRWKRQMRWEQLFERCQVTTHRHILYIAPNIANWCSAMTTIPIGALKVYLSWYHALKILFGFSIQDEQKLLVINDLWSSWMCITPLMHAAHELQTHESLRM